MAKRNPTCGCNPCNDIALGCDPCCRCIPERACARIEAPGCVCDRSAAYTEWDGETRSYSGVITCGGLTRLSDAAVDYTWASSSR